MPTFVLIFEDEPTVAVAPELRAAHVAYLQSLGAQAVLSGPTFSEDQAVIGRVIVADFPSLQDARAFADAEPLVKAGRAKVWRAAAMTVIQKDGVFKTAGG